MSVSHPGRRRDEGTDPLAMHASWIQAETARPAASGQSGTREGIVRGAWLLRRDVDLAGICRDPATGRRLELASAEVIAASTGDVELHLDGRWLLDARALGPRVAAAERLDVTEQLRERLAEAEAGRPSGDDGATVAIGLRHLEDGASGSAGGPGRVPASVIAGLVIRVIGTDGELRESVVGTDATWLAADADITYTPRTDPGRRPREEHRARPDSGGEQAWLVPGVMRTDTERAWRPARTVGTHPSLVHPPLLFAPPLVEEIATTVQEWRLAPGDVQCLDLGAPVRSRPVLAIPPGARRPVTIWAGPVPGSAPRGGDLQITTGGQGAILEAHATAAGRWLHIHAAPDLDAAELGEQWEIGELEMPVRIGILPRPLAVDVSDERVAQLLADGLAGLGARCQEQYQGEQGAPLLAEISRTARAALLAGQDTWRSARALGDFLATAREVPDGTVVDAIAPGGPVADLDEHTFALPAWIAAHHGAQSAPTGADAVLGGIAARLAARIEQGPSPAERMSTLAAAIEALDALISLRERAGDARRDTARGSEAAGDVPARDADAEDPLPTDRLRALRRTLRDQGRRTLRASRAAGGKGAWLPERGAASADAAAAALAVLAGLSTPDELIVTAAHLRDALREAPVPLADPHGLLRAALLRTDLALEVAAAHEPGDDVPPALLIELIGAISGLRMDGDRLHVRTPALELEGLELTLPHRRGHVRISWSGPDGSIEAPEGTHVLIHPDGGGAPVWYNSGTTALERPEPSRASVLP